MKKRMKDNIFLSIIVPVYNVSSYLETCVASIIAQEIKNFELILVDDGSTDQSGEICDKLKEEYQDFIKVIHQKNMGLSGARNTGLELAKGVYILFVDSDDALIPRTLKQLLDVALENDVDIAVGRAKYIKQNGVMIDKAYYCAKDGLYTGINYLNYILRKSGNNTFCAQFNMYKRSFIEMYNFRFKEGIIHEDELWTPSVFIKANTVYVSSIYFYYHFERQGSIMTGEKNQRKANSLFIVCESLNKIYSKYTKSNLKYLKNRMAMLYLRAYTLDENHINKINRFFPIKNACKRKTFLTALLFAISPTLFTKIRSKLIGES